VDPLQAGAGHEAGTCAMGAGEDAPCDPQGGLRALRNVWVADASVMPTPGDRHPTLTVMAHALRVAGAVSRYLRRTP
jgi:choline dehydrogenase-like flavoprotein